MTDSQREDYAKEARSDGAEAARNGQDECPHPPGCYEHHAWVRGHNAEMEFLKKFHGDLAKAQSAGAAE